MEINVKQGYESLAEAFQGALNQAQDGKGSNRHSYGEDFKQQKIMTIARWLEGNPAAALLYQVIKKAAETTRMEPEQAIHELDGVINYALAAKIRMQEIRDE